MKKKNSAALAALALAWSCVVHAEGYAGGSAGIMDADVAGDNPFNVGVRGGYRWPTGWGIEGEITTSLTNGKADVGFFGSVHYSVDTYAVYGTYRTPGDVYFKARLGLLDEQVDAGPADGSDSGLTGGAGIGFDVGRSAEVQIEYTYIEQDLNYWSGSVIFRF